MMPSLSVVQVAAVAAQEAGAGALLAAEAEAAVEQAGDEPLEADRHLAQPRARARAATRSMSELDTSVLPTAARRGPAVAVREEVVDRDGQVVVRVHAGPRSA